MKDLAICIRCHAYPTLVLDCIDSVRWACPNSYIFAAVDNNPQLAKQLTPIVDAVYCSDERLGWGAGLFSMLVRSIEFFEKSHEFSHFMSVDYDTLFISRDSDIRILSILTDTSIGLLGSYRRSHKHWAVKYAQEEHSFKKIFGRVPSSYIHGEGIQGGCMLLTRSLLQAFHNRGMFCPPFSCAHKHTAIADDHLIPIFCRMCGLGLQDATPLIFSEWRASKDPRNHDTKTTVVFHPSKLFPRNDNTASDRAVRNHFRSVRCQSPI